MRSVRDVRAKYDVPNGVPKTKEKKVAFDKRLRALHERKRVCANALFLDEASYDL